MALTIHNTMQQSTVITLSEVKLDPQLSGDEFDFEIPDDVDILDDRPDSQP